MSEKMPACLRITDADLQRALAYYQSTPTRVWGDRMVAALTELAEHRSRSITEEERERALKAAAEFLPMEGDDHCCGEPEQGFPGWTCCGMRGEHPDFIEFARKNAILIARALLSTSSSERGLREALEWQSIATAPKDGSEFIAFQDGDVYRCAWRVVESDETPGHEGWWDFSNSSFEEPSNWLPMPALSPKGEDELARG